MKACVPFAVVVLSLAAPVVAAGQGAGTRVSVQGAVGTQINAGGDNQSVSIGFALTDRLDILVSAERSHLPTEVTTVGGGAFGATRGGTTTFISGDVRFSPFTSVRISPYLLASAGRGVSRPNVNDMFPDPVTNDAWLLLFFGGGVRVPVTERLSVFADMRFGIRGERDTIALVRPVRGGVAWRF
jgi:hypothetical protein